VSDSKGCPTSLSGKRSTCWWPHLRISPKIFTTAHDAFAIMAFEVNALDCLLKPIAPERLAAALERLRPVRGLPPR